MVRHRNSEPTINITTLFTISTNIKFLQAIRSVPGKVTPAAAKLSKVDEKHLFIDKKKRLTKQPLFFDA